MQMTVIARISVRVAAAVAFAGLLFTLPTWLRANEQSERTGAHQKGELHPQTYLIHVKFGSTDAEGKQTIRCSPALAIAAEVPGVFHAGGRTPHDFTGKDGTPRTDSLDFGTNLAVVVHEAPNDHVTVNIQLENGERPQSNGRGIHSLSRTLRMIETVKIGESDMIPLTEAAGVERDWVEIRVENLR